MSKIFKLKTHLNAFKTWTFNNNYGFFQVIVAVFIITFVCKKDEEFEQYKIFEKKNGAEKNEVTTDCKLLAIIYEHPMAKELNSTLH